MVDEPEFIEMFDFVISLGAQTNPYLPSFLTFGEMFVNQKVRSLRLSAYGLVNKIDGRCPRTKVAVLKRAYRKEPVYGYCPTPEAAWGSKLFIDLEPLENVLHYFHVEADAAVAAMYPEDKRHLFLANVDCAATEAFITVKIIKNTKNAILGVCHMFYVQLEEGAKKLEGNVSFRKLLPEPSYKWMVFTAPVDKTARESATQVLAPKLLQFDVDSGKLLNAQDVKQTTEKPKGEFQLPWRLWCNSDAALHLGEEKTDEDAIQMVLRLLHKENHIVREPIDVLFDETRNCKRVIVTADILQGQQLQIVPCVPKSGKSYKCSEHPQRIPITVVRRVKQANAVTQPLSSKSTDTAVAVEPVEEVENIYYVHPEWKTPKGTIPDAKQRDCGAEMEWDWAGDETMHPFWAVRRLTTTQMSKERPDDKSVAGFNTGLTTKEYTVVTVGVVQGQSVAMTLLVKIPVITNLKTMNEGTELIMEQAEVQKQVTRKASTWKDESQAKRRKETQERKKERSNRMAKQTSDGTRVASAVTEI
jgi:hypothetical protein